MNSFFSSFTNFTQQFPAKIPVRIPNDDTTFNPKEYPNVVFLAKGKLHGKVHLIHDSADTKEAALGLISTRIWVVHENDKRNVDIKPIFNNKTHTFHLDGPSDFTANSIYHETTIRYPRSSTTTESLTVEAPNTSLGGEHLENLVFDVFKTTLSNGAIVLETIRSDVIQLKTSNAKIAGDFEAGHVDLSSSNGSITAKLNLQDALDGQQSVVSTKTSNAHIDIHVTVAETIRGLWMDNQTRNGSLAVGVFLGQADRASFIHSSTNNAKIDFNMDASQSGQPLEVENKSSNGGVTSSIMPSAYQRFKGSFESSNAGVNVNLTEAFQGNFTLETSNSSTKVEGSELFIDHDKKGYKHGHRVAEGGSQVKLQSSNSPVTLRFYPVGSSQASGSY
ncbi:hypothetical protein BGZ65_008974 [Modicella reniformis]|uniref:Uncharacterized protein n=1 Tax=Modicella reniformis TaxID=1440133 RepID=A0A9P6LS28_9FUNG|nr:hypothetical protein BGZ65_008974 [Modicella reniformis]